MSLRAKQTINLDCFALLGMKAKIPLENKAFNFAKLFLIDEQANASKIERLTDMYISTLRSHIESISGKLDIIARFPDG